MDRSQILQEINNYKQLQQQLQNQIGNLLNNQLIQKCKKLVQSININEQRETFNQLLNIQSFIDQYTEMKADWICNKFNNQFIQQLQQMWLKHSDWALKLINIYQNNIFKSTSISNNLTEIVHRSYFQII
ncbi:unnamed protein product [Paramecium sonneborni]|uniref:Uncharacterized protein n=1 Tax=Paramecium sonneborni TaxID=65129 RepID=A0A8S1QRU9_9CILI|nr:unnamed protein product [Paramecium sonneborni]